MLKQFFKNLTNKFLDTLFPENLKCIFCDDEINESAVNLTCPVCFEKLPRIENACLKCGTSQDFKDTPICFNCKSHNHDFEMARSPFIYQDNILQLVHKFKYDSGAYLAKPMAMFMAETYATMGVDVDFIAYVPLTKTKESERGYNQAELLAKQVSSLVQIPLVNLFEKVKDSKTQTALNTASRKENVKDCFKLTSEKRKAKNKSILIIDDVITTGATTSELSKIAKKGGIKSCFVLTFAHTKLENKN